MIRTGALIGLCVVLAGCQKSGEPPPAPGPSGVTLSFLSLFPAQRVAVVGDTITLRVTARDAAGADVANVAPTFSTTNAAIVRVDPDGRFVATGAGTATIRATTGGQSAETIIHVGVTTYDVASQGQPRVLTANYIDLSKIERVSRFRSAIGHSYADGSETCRSMKHYFQPKPSLDWTQVDVYAPAAGSIWGIAPDGSFGSRVVLRPKDLPALLITIFHVTLDSNIVVDAWVDAGQHLGRHASQNTMSDIAVSIGPGGTLLSYFLAITDSVFGGYQGRGVGSREAAIITKAERDADPVPCSGDSPFAVQGTLPNWVNLN